VANTTSKTQGTPFLQNRFYAELLEGFTEWVTRLGYADHSIKGRNRYARTFLQWLQSNHIATLEDIKAEHLHGYKTHLEQKALGTRTIGQYLSGIKLFDEYLQKYEYPSIIKTRITIEEPPDTIKTIVTKEEIKKLYEATDASPWGYRDRAVLAIYYGCGLRCNEGLELLTDDIDLKNNLLYVRKGKNYRQRHVPMSEGVRQDIKEYIEHGHKWFLKQSSSYVLINSKGKQTKGDALNKRLQGLCDKAGINKQITLHSLRHSIATHLLQNGMPLEKISQFLGHQSLETTQVYTHIQHEL
jgi:site-specific recombinase XerD